MNARERAKEFLNQQRLRAITRTGDPVQDLIDFVLSERGREPELEDAHAVVLRSYVSKAPSPSARCGEMTPQLAGNGAICPDERSRKSMEGYYRRPIEGLFCAFHRRGNLGCVSLSNGERSHGF